MWGIYFDALTAGVIAIGCNLGAYGSEVVRGGVLAVGKEQHPVTIHTQVPVDSAALIKQACFANLKKTAYDLRNSDYNYVEILAFLEG